MTLPFALMGLSLSRWFCSRTADRPPFSSSPFLPLAVPTSSRLAVTLNSPPVSPGDSRSHWSTVHRSLHFLLSPCKQEATRSPAELSSDGVRAEIGVKSGLHVWEVVWRPEHRGTHAVVGISRQDCPLQSSGYNVLVGADSQSWGWELKTNQLWHGGQTLKLYPENGSKRCHSEAAADSKSQSSSSSSAKMAQTPLLIPERVLLVLDADAGTLGFVLNGSFLGVAFKDLPRDVELFPTVSSVRGGACIRLRYMNGSTRECLIYLFVFVRRNIKIKHSLILNYVVSGLFSGDPPSLMALCGLSIRQNLGQKRLKHMDKLPLPPFLQRCLASSH